MKKLIVLSLGAFAVLAVPVHAEDWFAANGYRTYTWEMGPNNLRPVKRCGPECQKYRAAYWKRQAAAKSGTRVYAYVQRDRDDDRRPRCIDSRVKIISTEHTTQVNATEAGRKMWMAAAQWEWGSKYMDLAYADDAKIHCGPSNAMDTAAGKISEALSVGRDGQFNVRCVIDARPCRAKLEQMNQER